ncbi:hypothetical protein TSUD_97510 [Trifolium subterraneum]|uniref:Senescence regulator S40 n=1 Tax=Trifolium subterraneum TaxID=3900 RepID=A0A2Z6M2X0_TRISU|nr:hypothetical protein TSUD_97510 [Trifolium subterraneum]
MENNKNNYFARRNFFLSVSNDRDSSLSLTTDSDSVFEFEESDIYNSNHVNSVEFRKSIHGSRSVKKRSSSKVKDAGALAYTGGAPASMPVNIPDWSKILGDEYANNYMKRNGMEEDEDEDEDDGWLPPHEFLARTRVASFSVHEGIGRTLKGRDLSRLRNEIWAKTGFQ